MIIYWNMGDDRFKKFIFCGKYLWHSMIIPARKIRKECWKMTQGHSPKWYEYPKNSQKYPHRMERIITQLLCQRVTAIPPATYWGSPAALGESSWRWKVWDTLRLKSKTYRKYNIQCVYIYTCNMYDCVYSDIMWYWYNGVKLILNPFLWYGFQ